MSDPANPVVVNVTRGSIVESTHRGRIAVVDVTGAVKMRTGDIASPVYPRSSVKILQALPLVETGAADAAGFNDEELSLACSSHGGEVRHAETAARMLAKIGLSVDDLECGPHWPTHDDSARALAKAGQEPTALHNNCSGKHAGMLALALHLGAPTKGYIKPTHPVQQRILGGFEAMTGSDLSAAPVALDGCSAPTWAIPMHHTAFAFARIADPESTAANLAGDRATALTRLRKAVAAHPFMVAGTDRYCTKIIEVLGERAFVKTGAEGVYCASLPEYGLGVCLKCDDGSTRGAEMMMTAVMNQIGVITDADRQQLDDYMTVTLQNRRGLDVGCIEAADPFPAF